MSKLAVCSGCRTRQLTSDTNKFCTNCGINVVDNGPAVAEVCSKTTCARGTSKWKFCATCGGKRPEAEISAVNAMFKVLAAPTQAGAQSSGNAIKTVAEGSDTVTSAGQTIAKERDSIGKATEAAGRDPSTSSKTAVERQPAAVARERTVEAVAGAPAKMQAEFGGIVRPSLASSEATAGIAHLQSLTSAVERMTLYGTNVSRLDVSGAKQIRQSTKTAEAKSSDSGQSGSEQKQSASASDVQGRSFLINANEEKTSLGIKPSVDGKRNLLEISPGKATGPREDLDSLAESGAQPNAQQQQQEQQVQQVQNQPQQQELQEQWPQELQQQQRRQQESQEQQQQMKQLQRQEKQAIGFHNRFVEEEYDDVHAGLEAAGQWNFNAFANDVENADYEDEYDDARGLVNVFGGFGGNMYGPAQMDNRMNFGRLGGRVDHFRRGPFGMGPLPQPKSCTFVFWVYVSSLFGKFEDFCIRYKLMWSPKTNKPSNVTYEAPLRALKDGLMEVQLPLATRDFHRMFTNDEASMELVSYHYYAKRSSKTVYEAKLDAANNDMWRSVRVSGRDFSNNSNNRVKMCDGVSIPPDWQPRTPEASEILQKELNTCFRRCLPRLTSRTGRTEEKSWKSMTNFGADFSKVIEQFQRHYQRFSNEDEYNSVLNRHFSGQIEQVTMNIESEQIKRRDASRMLEPGLLVLATFDAFRRKQQLSSVCSTIGSLVGECCGLLLRFPSKEFGTVALDYTKNFRSSLGQYFVDERMYPANQQPTEPSFTEWRSCLTEMMYAFMNLPEETKVYTILLLPLYHALDDSFGAFEMAMTTSVGETDIRLRQKTQDWWGVGVLNNREDSFVSLRKCFAQAKMATLERMYELCRDALQVVPITSRIFVRFLSLEQLADFADVKFDRLSIESIVAALEWHFSDRSRSGSFNRFNRFNLALVHQALYKLCERLEPSSGEAAIERELASLKTDDNAMESWLRTQESTINLGQELLKGLLGAYFNEDEISKEWSKKKFSDDHFEALKACVKFVTCFAFTARRILDKRYGTHDGDFVEEIQLRRRTISEVMINIASAFSEVQAKVNGTLECMLPASFAAIDQKDDSSFDRRPLSFFASVFETMSIEQPCNELCDLLADAINTLDCQQRMALYCFTDPELSESAVTSASDKEQMKRLPEKIGQQINKNASDALSEAFEKVNVAVIESNRFAALVSEHFLSTMGQVIELDLIKDAQDTGVAASVKLKLIKGALKNNAVARMLEQMLCSEPLNGLLSEKALNCYQQLVRAFDTTQYSKLRDGEISLGAMELIDESAEQYVHLAGLCEKYLRPRSKMALSKLQECCDLRREEIGYYKKMKNMTMVFSGVLEQFTNSTLEKWRTKNREDDKSLAIKTLVMIRNDKREKLSTVNRYELPSDDFIEEVLEPLSKLEQSYWLRYLISDVAIPQLLRSNGEEARRSSSMEVLRRDVLKFAIDQLRRIYEKVKDGSILAKSMIKLIAVAKWDSDLLEEEYRKLAKFFNDSDGWIEDRLVQTKAVLKTDRSRSVAAQLKEVQKRYGLRGDFSIVDRVLDKSATDKLPLKKFRHELWHDSLSKYDEDSPECEALRDFARENVKQLVNWLRKEATTIRDFRVLIQLATDALGENAQDMMRVTMLSSAVNGYEALIYNVKEHHGFEELFGHCQSVFGRLQKDKDNRSLAKQLRDSASEMGWLESLTNIRGSVETSTVQEFELVHNYGKFRVLFETKQLAGRPASVALGVSLLIDKEAAKKDVEQQYKDVQEDSVQSSKTIALSRIKNASGEYSFDDIVDLTNRLMLISDNQTVNTGSDEGDNATRVGRATAKRQQFIQHFLTLFSQVTSLAEVSLELMSNQIQLFQELDCVFTCKASATDVSAESFELQLSKRFSEKFRIEFEQTAERTESVSLASECVRVLQVFFDYALNEWLGDLGKLREKYYELNHFTVKQLVLLRREMRKVDSEDRPDPRIYPILSAAFRCDVSEKAVVKAVQSMRKDYKEVKKQETEKNELGEAFKKKLQQLPIVMRDFNDVYGRWKQGQLDTSKPKSACELALRLNDLWLKYSDRVDSETEWLSLNQLSKVLSNLLLNSKINRVLIRRDVPVAIKKGAHNLAVCEEQNQLALLLSLYHEKNQKLARLPTREEVLLCNEKTTVEEIDLFWKRVTVPKPWYLAGDGLIYAIVGVHRLSYEVQSKAEVLMDIRKVAAEARGFAMVIICAREQENVCRMAITYGASRIDSDSFCKTTSEISAFVQGRLKLASVLSDNDKEQIKVPAAEIDAVKKGVEKSTVRFVRSDRAGVGKTLFIRRRTKDLRGLLLKSEEKEKYGCLSEDCENYETVAEIKQRQNFSDAINDRCRERQPLVVTLSLYKRAVDLDEALDALPVCSFTMADIIGVRQSDGVVQPCVYHIDIGHYVQENVDDLLFQLLIVGSVTSSDGFVWLKQKQDMYFVENLPIYRLTGKTPDDNTKCNGNERFLHSVLEFLPEQKCLSPEQTLQHLKTAYQSASTSTSTKLKEEDYELVVVDEDNYVLPYLHLREYTKARSNYYGIDKDLENFKLEKVVETHNDFLTTLLKTCGVEGPSWAELHNFCSFLDKQLGYCRNSAFYAMDSNKGSGVLPGFREFVVRFMIHMSRDFATRSLQIAEETPKAYAGKTLSDAELRDVNDGSVKTDLLNQYQMKRTWEASPHPYLFFNADKHSMTFLGFKLRLRNLHDPFELANAIDPYDQRRILMPNIMNTRLYKALENNHVKFNIEYDKLNKQEKIAVLANVIGMKKDSGSEAYYDPDPTYELTIDNMKKLLAIYMRLTCNIPVIIMGETGCGKTRMVNYLCQLQVSHQLSKKMNVCNVVTKKIHGGIQESELFKIVEKAEKLAEDNAKNQAEVPYTVLFLDETNSSEIVHLIKELLCDRRLKAKTLSAHLKIICACNPYRKHSGAVIKKQREAGLGYFKSESETRDVFGRMPMRHLVYRVQPLPKSLLPYVWDFGRLESRVEKLYIRQIVNRHVDEMYDCCVKNKTGEVIAHPLRKITIGDANESKTNTGYLAKALCRVLYRCQKFMRQQTDECSFVSLRDVERTLVVFRWILLVNWKTESVFFNSIDKQLKSRGVTSRYADALRAIILAIAVCYHCSLQNKRSDFRKHLAKEAFRKSPLRLPGVENVQKASTGAGGKQGAPDEAEPDEAEVEELANRILLEIECCQDVFLENCESQLGPNIARNQALKENIFMMIICIDLRIPLFLVGKPGSSKSLAKSIVENVMQGEKSETPLLRALKHAEFTSFQCSPHTTPADVIGALRQCVRFQKQKQEEKEKAAKESKASQPAESQSSSKDEIVLDWEEDRYVRVAVLDEIGLAEDSPLMPLKTLHSLLEDGVTEEDKPDDQLTDGTAASYRKIGFIGISNWALDPAKTNRGILVQRTMVSREELIETARGICKHSSEFLSDDAALRLKVRNYGEEIQRDLEPFIERLSDAYLEVYQRCNKLPHKEFFGLRDFYAMIKMLVQFLIGMKRRRNDAAAGSDTRVNKLRWTHFKHAILRNFSGLQDFEPLTIFEHRLADFFPEEIVTTRTRGNEKYVFDAGGVQEIDANLSDTSAVNLIRQNIRSSMLESLSESELRLLDQSHVASTRYLLIITEDYSSHSLLRQLVLGQDTGLIFGSKFPKDQQYTQICKDVNRIKLTMDIGKSCILLNMDALYESLYDVLNQYYSYWNGVKFVNLGLGRHKVKCKVDDKFKMIVVATKEVAYKFPIPLLSRMEKHLISARLLLNAEHRHAVEILEKFCRTFQGTNEAVIRRSSKSAQVALEDLIVGYSGETLASIVLHTWLQASNGQEASRRVDDEEFERRIVQCRELLIDCATTDAILRLNSKVGFDNELVKMLEKVYWHQLGHLDLADYLKRLWLQTRKDTFLQVTTFSRLLSLEKSEQNGFISALKDDTGDVVVQVYFLQAFDTILDFENASRSFMEEARNSARKHVLIIQMSKGESNRDLLLSAQLKIQDIYNMINPNAMQNVGNQRVFQSSFAVVFVVQIPRVVGGSFKGFQCGFWRSVHLDDLVREGEANVLVDLNWIRGKSLSQLFQGEDYDETKYAGSVPSGEMTDYLEIDKLIESLIPKAMSLILKPGGEDRKIQVNRRLKFVLSSSSSNCQEMVIIRKYMLREFRRKIAVFFWERERRQVSSNTLEADAWLRDEAASLHAIYNNETLSQSVVTYLKEKTAPILATILAYCDTNNNFDSLADLESVDGSQKPMSVWQRLSARIWWSIYKWNVFDFSFNDALSRVRSSASPPTGEETASDICKATEVYVHHVGFFDRSVQIIWLASELDRRGVKRLPFGYTMVQATEKIVQSLREDRFYGQKAKDPLRLFWMLAETGCNFGQGSVRKFLDEKVEESVGVDDTTERNTLEEQIRDAYLAEFLRCNYKFELQEEFDLVWRLFLQTAERIMKNASSWLGELSAGDATPADVNKRRKVLDVGDALNFIPVFHVLFSCLFTTRLEYLRELVQNVKSLQELFKSLDIPFEMPALSGEDLKDDIVTFDLVMFRKVLYELRSTINIVIYGNKVAATEMNKHEVWIKAVLTVGESVTNTAERQQKLLSHYFGVAADQIEKSVNVCRNDLQSLHLVILFRNEVSSKCTRSHDSQVLEPTLNGSKLLLRFWNYVKPCERNNTSSLDVDKIASLLEELVNSVPGVNYCAPCKAPRDVCYQVTCGNHQFSVCSVCWKRDSSVSCPECRRKMQLRDDSDRKLSDVSVLRLAFGRFFARFIALVLQDQKRRDAVHQTSDEARLKSKKEIVKKLLTFVIAEPMAHRQADANAKPAVAAITRLVACFGKHNSDVLSKAPSALQTFILRHLLDLARSNAAKAEEPIDTTFTDFAKVKANATEQSIYATQFCVGCVIALEDLKHFDSLSVGVGDDISRLKRISGAMSKRLGNQRRERLRDIGVWRKVVSARLDMHELVEIAHSCVNAGSEKQVWNAENKSALVNCLVSLKELVVAGVEVHHDYFMRLFVRNYGRSALRALIGLDNEKLKAISPPMNDSVATSALGKEIDFFVLYGKEYSRAHKKWRDWFEHVQVAHSPRANTIDGMIFGFFAFMRLTGLFDTSLEQLRSTAFCDESAIEYLIRTVTMQRKLELQRALPGHLYDIVSHFAICVYLARLFGNKSKFDVLLSSLYCLASTPDKAVGFYLPGMPSDSLNPARQTSNDGRNVYGSQFGNHNVKQAGGQNQNQHQNQSMGGHNLGSSSKRRVELIELRELSPVGVSVMRMFTHLALLTSSIGVMQQQQQSPAASVMKMIHVFDDSVRQLSVQDLSLFLVKHLEVDFRMLMLALGSKNADEVCLLFHGMLKRLLELVVDSAESKLQPIRFPIAIGELTNEWVKKLSWETASGRDEWEEFFIEHVVTPQLLDKSLSLAVLADDKSIDVKYHDRALIEYAWKGEAAKDEEPLKKRLWRVRQRVTIGNIERKLREERSRRGRKQGGLEKMRFELTGLFLSNYRVFAQLQRLPSILELFRELLPLANRKYSKQDAGKLEMNDFLKNLDEQQRKAIESKIDELCYVWNIVRDQLMDYSFGGYSLQNVVDKSAQLSRASTIDHFLPASHGRGLCALLLTTFLIEQHNKLVKVAASIAVRRRSAVADVRSESAVETLHVNIGDVNRAHMVDFNGERDIMELLELNATSSDSSEAAGDGGSLQYDFPEIEGHIEEAWLGMKPQIVFHLPQAHGDDDDDDRHATFRTVVFIEDITTDLNFGKLGTLIAQVALPSIVVKSIRTECDLPQINQMIRDLEVAVAWLTTSDTRSDSNLATIMEDDYGIKNALSQSKVVKEHSKLEHVESLWFALNYRAALKHKKNKHDPFGNIDEQMKTKLADDQRIDLKERVFGYIKLENFMEAMFGVIVRRQPLTGAGSKRVSEYVNRSLQDVLREYVRSVLRSTGLDSKEFESKIDSQYGVSRIPKSLIVCHSVDIFNLAFDYLESST